MISNGLDAAFLALFLGEIQKILHLKIWFRFTFINMKIQVHGSNLQIKKCENNLKTFWIQQDLNLQRGIDLHEQLLYRPLGLRKSTCKEMIISDYSVINRISVRLIYRIYDISAEIGIKSAISAKFLKISSRQESYQRRE